MQDLHLVHAKNNLTVLVAIITVLFLLVVVLPVILPLGIPKMLISDWLHPSKGGNILAMPGQRHNESTKAAGPYFFLL